MKNLVLPEKIEKKLSLTGATQNLSRHEWEAVIDLFQRVDRAKQWIIGDYYKQAAGKNWGHTYEDAQELFGVSTDTAKRYASVSKSVQLLRRINNLSFEHHAKVARFPPEKQRCYLQRASDDSLSRAQFDRLIAVRENCPDHYAVAVEFDAKRRDVFRHPIIC